MAVVMAMARTAVEFVDDPLCTTTVPDSRQQPPPSPSWNIGVGNVTVEDLDILDEVVRSTLQTIVLARQR
jgi:hypothetical protein